MNKRGINLPAKPGTSGNAQGKSVFIHGRGIVTEAAIKAADRMIERLKEINGILVTTDDPNSLDRYLVQRAALRGVRAIVHGLNEHPRKQLPTAAEYTRYLNPERVQGGLAWYKRNLAAAISADQAVIVVSDPRYAEAQRKFASTIRRETGREATLFPLPQGSAVRSERGEPRSEKRTPNGALQTDRLSSPNEGGQSHD